MDINQLDMKNFKLVLVVIVAVLFAHSAFSKNVEIIKRNGHRTFLTFWKITYKYVHYDPCGGSCGDGLLECTGKGSESCEMPETPGGSVVIDNNSYPADVISRYSNEISDLIDDAIFNGKEKGSISKKVQIKTTNGKKRILSFLANWKDANVKTGDVRYILRIHELSL